MMRKTSLLFLLTANSCLMVLHGCFEPTNPIPVEDPITKLYTPSQIVGAPPLFSHPNLPGKIAPIDIKRAIHEVVVDVTHETISGESKLWFEMQEGGYPLFDFSGTVESLKLNGRDIDPGKIKTRITPAGKTRLRVIDELLRPNSPYTMQMKFRMPPHGKWQKFSDNGVDLFFFYNDYNAAHGQGFIGRYLPANLEFDQYSTDLRIQLKGHKARHQLFSNGAVRKMSKNSWRISYPEFFNSSAIYLHLSEKPFYIEKKTVVTSQNRISVTVYSPERKTTDAGASLLEKKLSTYVKEFGRFPFDKYVLQLHSNRYGMEYAGAALSHLDTIGHELLHSWFGRWIFPANGNSAWIDEAVVTWADKGFPKSRREAIPQSINMAFADPYNRMTSKAAYLYGVRVMQSLDARSRNGLKPIIKEFLNLAGGLVITNKDFHTFLAQRMGEETVNEVFCSAIYGSQSDDCPQAINLEATN